MFGIIFFAIVPQIIQPTNSIWFVPRATYCFASTYGVLVLFIAMNYDVEEFSKNLILIISFLLVFFQAQKFIQIEYPNTPMKTEEES